MKKILLPIMVYTLLFTINISASELDMTKEEMMRSNPIASTQQPTSAPLISSRMQPSELAEEESNSEINLVSMEEQSEKEDSSKVTIILVTIVIIIVLLVTFVIRYVLSIKDKNDNVYDKETNSKKEEDK